MEVLRKAHDRMGCRDLQHTLQAGTFKEQNMILHQLRGHVVEIAQSPNGNYLLQHAIRVLSSDRTRFIADELFVWRRPAEVAKHKYACRILERIIEHFPINLSFPFMEDIVRNTKSLSMHPIGTYSVQHCVEHGGAGCVQEIANVVLNHLHQIAVDPSGCGVLNKVLLHANSYQSTLLAVALASHPHTFANMATLQQGFAACESLFHVAKRIPELHQQMEWLLTESMGKILSTRHGHALLRTLALGLQSKPKKKRTGQAVINLSTVPKTRVPAGLLPAALQQGEETSAAAAAAADTGAAPPAALSRWAQPALPALKSRQRF